MSDETKNRKDEMDAFWDIKRLVPQKPKSSHAKSRPAPKSVPIELCPQDHRKGADEEVKLTVSPSDFNPKTSEEPTVFAEYIDFSPLLPRVKIINWKSTYNYYEFFCRQAAAIHKKRGEDCPEAPFAPFFSYVAQYSQLNRRQLAWYLWWRECVRNERYLKTDISYIHLLIFELINLGNTIDTKKSLDILIGLWSNYKDDFPQLNSTLGEWICDYSLIHNLPFRFSNTLMEKDFLQSVSFPEAYYNLDIHETTQFARFLLSACNGYNYRKSKFYKDENKGLYDMYIPQAAYHLLEKIDIPSFLSQHPKKVISRMAYTGALCSYKTRKHIEVEYIPLCDSHELKTRIGDIVKYAENKLRTCLGIRSKLSIREIDPRATEEIDSFFAGVFPSENGVRVPEYEKLYESVGTDFSLSSALNIEEQSWEITEKLIEAFEEAESVQEVAVETVPPKEEQTVVGISENEQFVVRISRYMEFFSLVLENNTNEQKGWARRNNILPEAIVDEINECAVEIFGDILIEETDSGYCIIEEYRSLFE